ncbi:MAG: Gfo/Idh/MocA family oxidoreductase [Pirellulales bacterium]|nr:Gfo/Idh/MocA family oxidoreductase [Pirellulales bacterium]
MAGLTRRCLLKSGIASTLFTVAGTKASGKVVGANDAIRVGVVGMGRGQQHIAAVDKLDGLRLAALCDVDPARLGKEVDNTKRRGGKVLSLNDVRKLLDRNDIDAITVATPNHWHSLMGIWACQAGKDAYIEKPVSHNVWEGRQLVKAARKHQRIVQTGTQARANTDLSDALKWLKEGNLGKIKYARGMCYKGRMSIGKVGKQGGEIPPGLDYDLWSGPAPLQQPLRRKQLHYDWHWIYDYGNGDLGNQGVHEVDIARWFLGYDRLPPRVMSIGGRFGYEDDGQTPNTQSVFFDYDGPPIIFDVRGLPKSKEFQSDMRKWLTNMPGEPGFKGGATIGVIVVCEGGRLIIEDGGFQLFAADPDGKIIRRFETTHERFGKGWAKGTLLNFSNWAQAMRTRKPGQLTADILEGHISSSLCHVGMISHRLGQTKPTASILERIKDDSLFQERFESFKDHLGRNGVDLSKVHATLGPGLKINPAAERFLENNTANTMLSHPYRTGFEVPEKV